MWCFLCGASANVMARHLARPCCGRARGFLRYARRRLLLGLHPRTRVPLGGITVPEVGAVLPEGYDAALRQALASSTVAAAPTRVAPIVEQARSAAGSAGPAAAPAEPAWRVAMLTRLRVRWSAEAEVVVAVPASSLGGHIRTCGDAGSAGAAVVLRERPVAEPPPPKRRRLRGKQPMQ